MKFTEKEIQNYIWSKRDDFSVLLQDGCCEIEKPFFREDLSDLNANSLVRHRLNKKIKALYSKIFGLNLFGCEVPLLQAGNSTIRTDFLASFLDDTGIAVLELKKSSQTERQAFTELLAYSNHLTTIFPTMSRDDIVYVLISPMETRIARDAVIQSLTFDNRQIIALVPDFEDPNDITTLKLKLWMPSDSELAELSAVAFNGSNFSVCKIVWEHNEEWWNPDKHENPSPHHIYKFNTIASQASQLMEEAGIHGFSYCSQLWSEFSELLPYTNSLVIVGLNPFAVARSHESLDSATMEHFFPNGLDPVNSEYVYESLETIWSSQLFRIGRRVVESATKTLDGNEGHIDQTFLDWKSYQDQLTEAICSNNFLVRPTGMIRDLFEDVKDADFSACRRVGLENHPIHADMPYLGVDYLSSLNYFRQFIVRMFNAD
ncbi:hypothetical protein [Pseudoalteromonas ruthenica]|uniref:hypothetical protein n=1 Tax=Pseudoalteromonas ruthenica TaxID=151081 RepID=UPI001246BCBD|nr:hypothetical protein [Pseudoalteromonas ruthenica]